MSSTPPKKSIILGVDPGTLVTGYGVIAADSDFEALDYGCVRPPPSQQLSDRYLIIFNALETLIQKFRPDVVVVETQYVGKNVQSAIKLGMARGTVIIAARKNGVEVVEYSPARLKSAVFHGRATKKEVQNMVKHLLRLPRIPQPEDAADALALAICHANILRNSTAIAKAV